MHHLHLIELMAIGLGLAMVFGLLAQRLRMPPLVGYLLAGVVIGPATPGFDGDLELAHQLSEIGVMLLMFGVGLHFSLEDLLRVRRIAVPGALVQIAAATGMGMVPALLWGWPWGQALVFGLSGAAFVAEDTAVTDSAFSWTKTTDEVENVQTWIPISRNMVYDEPFMVSTIQGMLADRLAKKISQQLMYGTGTTPQLWGCTVRTGFQTQAKGADPAFDALLKAATLVAVTGDATPDAFVIHPTDWQNLVLTRTTDGIYILGNPGNPPANPTLWGLPVRVSSTVAAAAGTAAVGAFRTMAAAVYNGGVVVETATEHSTYFTENKIALSLRQRMSAVHYRPSAFAKVTGL